MRLLALSKTGGHGTGQMNRHWWVACCQPCLPMTAKRRPGLIGTPHETYPREDVRALSVKPGNRPALGCCVSAQIDHHLVDETPTPSFGRVIAFDDGMVGGMEVLRGMAVWGVIAAADMSTGSAEPKMYPFATSFQALLATERARNDSSNQACMRAAFSHFSSINESPVCPGRAASR
jgi:hypothetical protein